MGFTHIEQELKVIYIWTELVDHQNCDVQQLIWYVNQNQRSLHSSFFYGRGGGSGIGREMALDIEQNGPLELD